ncbi:hypothetical protein GCM10022260_26840 [Gaetbulibacter aestuarii]
MARFLRAHSDYLGEGYFQGKLFNVSWFPGAVLSDRESDLVYGHVFRLKNENKVFSVLDDYEGIGEAYEKPHLFKKVLVSVILDRITELPCWVYLYNLSVDGLQQITSGNYLEFKK